MTVYSIPQIAGIWQQAGGAKPATVNAVAVCLAESGGDSEAISPSADYGLWQINRSNFPAYGLNDSNWMLPFVNAGVAIKMSGNGANWAAWCTCWPPDQLGNCGHGFIAGPQHGSAAYSHVAYVASVLGVSPPQYVDNQGNFSAPAGARYGGQNQVANAWGGFQTFLGPWGRSYYSSLTGTRQQIQRV